MSKTKPFDISKRAVWKAWKRVRANQGAPGVDEQSIADFEEDLSGNLYKIWNRMSSGSYFPDPVRLVDIPKTTGGKRTLGIPTVADRVAQMVVKLYLEPKVDPEFHPDSYGYRPEKSATEAVGQARERCWQYSWVLDFDIKGFFDNIDHALMLGAVRKHTDCPWVLLYIERWLQAPGVDGDGQRIRRDQGTPQGGVISPLLANIFLHHVLDKWMADSYPSLPFERYADDMIVHCRSERQARFIRHRIEERLQRCKLELHPRKTKIVFCKKNGRSGSHEHVSFDFLGFTFQPRMARSRDGELFLSFLPAISERAATTARRAMRDWGLQRRSERSLEELARMYGAKLRGWIEYYGSYGKWRLSKVFTALNNRLVRWAQRKYKRFRRYGETLSWLRRIAKRKPGLFPHWEAGFLP